MKMKIKNENPGDLKVTSQIENNLNTDKRILDNSEVYFRWDNLNLSTPKKNSNRCEWKYL